jgi:chromosome segregation ATPase
MKRQSPRAAAPAANRRGAAERAKREEGELRSNIEQEIERLRDMRQQASSNDKRIAELNGQLQRLVAKQEEDRMQVSLELEGWEQRLDEVRQRHEEKTHRLGSLSETMRSLQQQRGIAKIHLAAFFVREDMKPDFPVSASEIFTTSHSRGAFGSFRDSPSKRMTSIRWADGDAPFGTSNAYRPSANRLDQEGGA